jgi:hypothetical protein
MSARIASHGLFEKSIDLFRKEYSISQEKSTENFM